MALAEVLIGQLIQRLPSYDYLRIKSLCVTTAECYRIGPPLLPLSQSQNFSNKSLMTIFINLTAYLLPHFAANEYNDLSRSRARSSGCGPGALASPKNDSTLLPIRPRGGAAAVVVVIGTFVVEDRLGPLVALEGGVGAGVEGVVVVVVVLLVGVGVVEVVVVVGVVVLGVVVVDVVVVGGGVVVSTIGSKVVVSWSRCRVREKTG